MKGKIPLAEAQRIALDWKRCLAPDCRRFGIAGSIRRKRETVGDIEIVAIPEPGKSNRSALLPGFPPTTSEQKPPPLFDRIRTLTYFESGPSPIVITKGAPGLMNGKARYIQLYDRNEKLYIDLFLATRQT